MNHTAQLRSSWSIAISASAAAFALLISGCVKQPGAPEASNMGSSATISPTNPGVSNEPEAPVVPRTKGENIFVGAKWWVDPYGNASLAVKRLKNTNSLEESQLLAKIAEYGGAEWIGDWTPNVENWIHKKVKQINKAQAFPLFLAYNI